MRKLEILGYVIGIFIGLNILISSLFVLINKEITGNILWISLVISLILFGVFLIKEKTNYKIIFSLFILFLGLFWISTKLSLIFMDFSYDGQTYHQEAILQLHEGWNPLYEDIDETYPHSIWINHYAKANWYLGTILYDVFERIEITKTFNFLLFIGTFLITYSSFKAILRKSHQAILLSTIAVFNPVTVNLLFTNYNDGLVGLLLLNLLTSFFSYIREGKLYTLFNILAVIIFVTNIKFTALGYTVILCGIPIVYVIYNGYRKNGNLFEGLKVKKNIRLISVILTSMILSILLVGAPTYVKNFVNHGHPFYPLAGEEKVDIITTNSPVGILEYNRIEKLYISIMSETSNDLSSFPKIKFPLSISENEYAYAGGFDTRIGGFGPLFGIIVILVTVGIIIMRKEIFQKNNLMYFIFLVVYILSIFINSETWWARYIPQLWLLPVIVLLLMFRYKKSNTKVIGYIIISIFLLNISITTYSNIKTLSSYQNDIVTQFEALKRLEKEESFKVNFSSFVSNRAKFIENDLKYVETEVCEYPVEIVISMAKVCLESEAELIEYNNYIND